MPKDSHKDPQKAMSEKLPRLSAPGQIKSVCSIRYEIKESPTGLSRQTGWKVHQSGSAIESSQIESSRVFQKGGFSRRQSKSCGRSGP